MAGSSLTRLLGALQDEIVAGGDASGTLAFTTGGMQFAGVGVETISGTLAATLGSVTFAGVGVETETGSLAFTTGSISFAGVGVETETGTLALTTGAITFAGVGNVATADVTGTLGFTTGSIVFSGTGTVIAAEEGLGGGSGYPVYGKYVRPKGISEFLDIAMSDIYTEGTKEAAPKALKAKIVKLVKPYKKQDSIDWNAFEKDTIRVQEMIDLWNKQIMEEDELIIAAYMEFYH